MSTGYMSGEAYELPEAREPLMEPTLASVEEISGSLRSEDLFTLTHSQVLLLGFIGNCYVIGGENGKTVEL